MRRSVWSMASVAGFFLLCAGLAGCTAEQSAPQAPPPPIPTAEPENDGPKAAKAPDTYRVKFETTKGDFVVEVNRDWAPRGADRFYELVQAHFFDDCKFFRVVKEPKPFMVQFGIHGDPSVSRKWREATIRDDVPKESNQRGMITFATSGPNSRTTQVFINYGDNSFLDSQGFAPFGRVIEGMDVVDSLEGKYGEKPSSAQGQIQAEGNAFLARAFPGLDSIKSARIVTGDETPAEKASAPDAEPKKEESKGDESKSE